MNYNNLKKMYDAEQYTKIIEIFDNASEEKEDELSLYAGFIFTKMGMALKAIDCLSSIDRNKFPGYLGKINRYLGLANYYLGNYDTAQSLFESGANEKDQESVLWGRLLFPSLHEKRETGAIIFRFVDEISAFNKIIFILKNIKAFTRIREFIEKYNDDKKIDIYVYSQRKDSIGNLLSYSDNGLKYIHTYLHDTNGHEITHILFNSIYKVMNRNKFIDEGIATFFDNENTFTEFILKHQKYLPNFDVIEIWKNPDLFLEDTRGFYNFAGAFVGFLLQTYGKKQFIKFIQDEEYKNALTIFGNSLDSTIQNFYNEISLLAFL